MKNICFIKEDITVKGGSERVACILMNELSKFYNVSCISIKSKNRIPAYYLNPTIKVNYLTKLTLRMRYLLPLLYFKYLYFIIKNRVDIVLNLGMAGVPISFIVKKIFKRKKMISCEHSNLKNMISNNLSQKKAQRLAAMFSDKIITLTEKDKINYIEKFNLDENKVSYIYNFMEDSLLNSKSEYSLDSKKIITVGRFDKVKGYDRLVKIAKKILEKYKDWEWHIYGDGKEFSNIQKLIIENNLEDKLILKGNVDNIYEIYSQYSFYVMTSYFEGLPMVLLEAKVNSLPLISFDIDTGPSEIIRDGVDGFLIENNNLEEMQNKIEFLIENSKIRREFSNNSRGNIEKFKKETIIKEWIKIITEI